MTEAAAASPATSPVAEAGGKGRGVERRYLALLLGFSRPCRGRLALWGVLTATRAASLGLALYFFTAALTALFAGGEGAAPGAALLAAVAGLVTCQVIAALSQFLAEETQRRFLEEVELAMLRWALGHVVHLPADYFRDRSHGKLAFQLEKLQTTTRTYVTSLLALVSRCLVIASILGTTFLLAPLFAAVAVALLAGVAVLAYRHAYHLRFLAKDEDENDVGLVEGLLTVFSNQRDLHNFGLLASAVRQFTDACRVLVARVVQKSRAHGGVGLWVNGAGILLLTGAALALAGGGAWEVGALTCFAALVMILEPLTDLIRTRITLQSRLLRVGDVFEIVESLGTPPTGTPAGGELVLEKLLVQNVSYHVQGMPILQNVSFWVRRGEILGIVGRSGAGKTTLANLLLRFVEPTDGRVMINGQEDVHLDPAEYWRQTAYVTQDPQRINGTLADDVALGSPRATEEEIGRALDAAGIPPELCDRGPNSEGGNDGRGEGVGRTRSLQQRAEWARLFLRSARLVVLDEPTSLVDAAEEERFVRSLLDRRHERMTVLISHRPATLAACDRILVLDEGRIVDRGLRDEILARWWPGHEVARGLAS